MGAVTALADLSAAECAIANRALARIGAEFIRDTAEDTPSNRQCKALFPSTRNELLRDYEFNFAQKIFTLVEDVGTTILSCTKTSASATIGFTGQTINALVGKTITAASGIPADTVIISNTATVGVMSKVATDSTGFTATVTRAKAPWLHVFLIPTSPVILKVLEIAGNADNRYQVVGADSERRILCDVETTDGFLEARMVEEVSNTTYWDSMFTDAFVLRLASKLAVPLVKRADLGQVLQQEFAAIYSMAKKSSSEEAVLQVTQPMWTDRSQSSQAGQ
jgi:hypothetical protein